MVPANIMIMLDNSGSMGWDTNGCPSGRWWCTHNGQVRMVLAKAAIQSLLSQQQLTSSANFGLQQWGSGSFPNNKIRVGISTTGATTIRTDVNNVVAGGGTDLLAAMTKARNYFNATPAVVDGFRSPIIQNASCQLNFIILISDGQWHSHSQAMSIVTDMKDRLNVKTFAVGFAVSSSYKRYYEDVADNGGTNDAPVSYTHLTLPTKA